MASKSDIPSKKNYRRRKPLVQGRLVLEELKAKDDVPDPTISPLKSVPKLTEDMFPHAEPPSKYLDLSDEDGEKDAALPQPVLVCDASHLAVSPDGTEVDVIIGYEPSPVKVVCHTPGKLIQDTEKSPGIKSRSEPKSKPSTESVSATDFNASNETLAQQKQKKSKSYRVVQSRYMQPSLNKTQNLSKTLISSKDSSGHQRSAGNISKPEKISRSSSSVRKQKASTPTFDEKSLFLEDISTIQSTSVMSCHGALPAASEASIPHKQMDLKRPVPKIKDKLAKPAGKADKEAEALKVHFAYTRYLQYAFLNLKAEKALKDRDAAATAELSKLWQVMESQREELSKTESEVSNLKRMLLAEEILEKTEPELSPAASSLPGDYSSLADAVDTTLHQLPVKDIVVPQSEPEREKFEKDVGDILCESDKILSDIKEIVSGEVEHMNQYAENLKSIEKCYTETSAELQSSQKDLVQVQDLTTEMTSLVIQNMQDCEEN